MGRTIRTSVERVVIGSVNGPSLSPAEPTIARENGSGSLDYTVYETKKPTVPVALNNESLG